MNDGVGDFAWGEPVHVLALVVNVNLELDRGEVDANRVGRFILQDYFDGQNACGKGIRFAEHVLGVRGVRDWIDGDGHAAVFIVRQAWGGGSSGNGCRVC